MTDRRLAERTAIVTGSSSGLGKEIAQALAREGARVVGFARRHALDRVPGDLPPGAVTEVSLDVTREADVAARFAEIKRRIDIVVCCAGHAVFGGTIDARVDDVRSLLDVHIVGAFLAARELLRHARDAADGAPRFLVNVSSIAAFRTFTGGGAYTAAKEGLRGLTRVLVEEARPLGVRVVGFYPGATDTPLWDGTSFDRGRMMTPADVAGLLVDVVSRPGMTVEEIVIMPPGGAL